MKRKTTLNNCQNKRITKTKIYLTTIKPTQRFILWVIVFFFSKCIFVELLDHHQLVKLNRYESKRPEICKEVGKSKKSWTEKIHVLYRGSVGFIDWDSHQTDGLVSETGIDFSRYLFEFKICCFYDRLFHFRNPFIWLCQLAYQ